MATTPILAAEETCFDTEDAGNGMSFKCALLLCCTIFTKEICGISVSGSIVDPVLISAAAIGLLVSTGNRFVWRVGFIWSCILILSWFLLDGFSYPIDVFAKQGLVAAVVYVGIAGLLVRTTPGDLQRAYEMVAVFAACFGVVQYLLSLGGMFLLIKVPGRLDSFAYEPSHYAIAIAPAFYLAVSRVYLTRNVFDWRAGVIALSLLLTASLTAIVLMVFSLSLALFSRRNVALVLVVIASGLWVLANPLVLPSEVQNRLEAIQSSADDLDVRSVENLSVFSPVSNWEVAMSTLQSGRWLGNGFGGHLYAYEDYFGAIGSVLKEERYGVNAIGAHSLFIRAVSELGVLGLLAYLWLVLKGSFADRQYVWWALLAVYLVGRALKLGSPFEIGMPVFLLAPFAFYWKIGCRDDGVVSGVDVACDVE